MLLDSWYWIIYPCLFKKLCQVQCIIAGNFYDKRASLYVILLELSLIHFSASIKAISECMFFSKIEQIQGIFHIRYFIQHCFICRPSDSTASEEAGIEPRTVATLALAARRSNHSARSHPQSARSHPQSARSHPQLGYRSHLHALYYCTGRRVS